MALAANPFLPCHMATTPSCFPHTQVISDGWKEVSKAQGLLTVKPDLEGMGESLSSALTCLFHSETEQHFS